jgi:MraZ protein
MTKNFRGRFDCKVDAKGRAILPSPFRDSRAAKFNSDWIITNSIVSSRRCLDLYLLSDWEKLEKKISQMPQLNKDVQAYQRFYLSGGQYLQLDSQNRLSLPQNLRKFADAENSIVMVGMGHKIEIWSESIWSELQDKMIENYEDTVVRVANLEEGLRG